MAKKTEKEESKKSLPPDLPKDEGEETAQRNRAIKSPGQLVKVRARQPLVEDSYHAKGSVFHVTASRAAALGHLVEILPDQGPAPEQ